MSHAREEHPSVDARSATVDRCVLPDEDTRRTSVVLQRKEARGRDAWKESTYLPEGKNILVLQLKMASNGCV
jgi:hypothetical protein